jgi:hypothetical protein
MERRPPIYLYNYPPETAIRWPFQVGIQLSSDTGGILWSKESYGIEQEAVDAAQEAFPHSRLKIERGEEERV